MKTCSKCREPKPVEGFSRHAKARDGLRSYCKACASIISLPYRIANRDKLVARAAAWRAQHRERDNARSRAYRLANLERSTARVVAWGKGHLDHKVVHTQRVRARKEGATGDVTVDQWKDMLEQSVGVCAYCSRRARLTMDHVVPLSAGGAHDMGNVGAVCGKCNRSKGKTPLIVWMARKFAKVARLH